MRYLVLTNTPAHVHLYRNAVDALRADGHTVTVLARDYGCTVELLEWYGLPFEVYGACGTTRGSLLRNLPSQLVTIARSARAFRPDVVFGMGTYAAVAGTAARAPVVLLLDSEPTSVDHALSVPVATAVLTPATFRKSLGGDHFVFDGFKESAYLHPDEFEPDPGVREQLGLAPDERFVLVRLNAFGSHHDVGEGGFGPADRPRLIERLARHATVLVSDERGDLDLSGLPARLYDAHPGRLHDALAEASLLVADTQTMVTEAALLGTPAVRSNSFVGEHDMGNFLDLEAAGLVVNCSDVDAVLETVDRLLERDDERLQREWRTRRDAYHREFVNLTDVITSVAAAPHDAARIPELRRWSDAAGATTGAADDAIQPLGNRP